MTTKTTTTDPDVTLGAALQARALGILTADGCVWSRAELAEQLAEEVESGLPDFSVTVAQALDALVGEGLAHRVNDELVAATRRGRAARRLGVDPGEGQALRVPESGGSVGVVETINDPDATDRLDGGAEHLPSGLEQLVGPHANEDEASGD
jgi:hypothetical protein